MSWISPRISLLSHEQIAEIHSKSIELLENTGVRIDSLLAKQLFSKASGNTNDQEYTKISSDLVEWALSKVPSSVEIFDRNGDIAFQLDSENQKNTYFGTGCTNLYYEDSGKGDIVSFTKEHVKITSQIGHALENFDVISTPGIIETSLPYHELYTSLEMLANTSKPLVLLIDDSQRFRDTLSMMRFIYNDLNSKPFIIPYFNPISPLVINESTVNKIISTTEFGLPFIFSNYGMSGATTPITGAGTLVTLNAELLAGLVLTQLIKEGNKVILGSLPAVFDQRSMIANYNNQSMLLNLACSEMMYYYKIPHCGTSGSGTGWGADILGSGMLWTNHLSSCIGKVGIAPFVGGNLASLVYSPETVVYSDYIISMARKFSKGIQINSETIGMDEINKTGPGGDFLTSDLTLKHFADYQTQQSKIWPIYSFEEWQKIGSPTAKSNLHQYTIDLISNLETMPGYKEIIEQGEEFINKLSKSDS